MKKKYNTPFGLPPVKMQNSLDAHRRLMVKHTEAYSMNHKDSDFGKAHYHFHVIDMMQKKRRILTLKEKREIYRIKTDPRYR